MADEFVRKDVYQVDKELVSERIAGIREDIHEINERTRWLLRTVVTAVIMLFGNFVFLFLTRVLSNGG